MRVVLASRIFAPEPAAASFRLVALARALHDDGAEVTVLTSRAPDGSDTGLPESVEVRRAPVLRDKTGAVRGYLQYLSFDIPLLFRLLFVRRPDAVVVEPPPTTGAVVRIVCGLRRIPYVYYAADILSDAAASSGSPAFVVTVVRAMERWALRGAAAVLSVSAGVTARLAELGAGDSVDTVGNGIDTTQFSAHGVAHDLGAPYLLYAGTASGIQGAEIFARAFESVLPTHPDARLVFMGQRTDGGLLKSVAAGLPAASVVFEPRRSASDAAEWLRGAAASLASIVPGQGYDFAFPTKVHAAVACGTPVIYAGPGPVREFMGLADLGWAVEYSIPAVAASMTAALDEPIDRDERIRRAEWGAERITLDAVAKRAADIVNRVGIR